MGKKESYGDLSIRNTSSAAARDKPVAALDTTGRMLFAPAVGDVDYGLPGTYRAHGNHHPFSLLSGHGWYRKAALFHVALYLRADPITLVLCAWAPVGAVRS